MSGGLTSYPRTGGGGIAKIVVIRRLLEQIRSGGGSTSTNNAVDLVQALEDLSRSTKDHAAMVSLSIEVRNVIFAAVCAGTVVGSIYARAMEVCARHWEVLNPLSSASFAARVAAAYQMFASAADVAGVRAAQEQAGITAWLYRASALLGQDLNTSHLATAVQFEQTLYTGARDQRGTLRYLECGASYNVNEFLRVEIPGSRLPLIIAGEAKGGSGRYGWIAGPTYILEELKVEQVNQRDPAYALTRAAYMAEGEGISPASVARREAGEEIQRAYNQGNFIYLAVRGKIDGATLSVQQEVFKCR
jgi:hypothetical protein